MRVASRSKDAMVKEELERFQRQEEVRSACNIRKSGPTGYFTPFVENVSKLGSARPSSLVA